MDYLTTQCEEALALSALPEQLRAGSSIYVLKPEGFTKTVEGTGTFTCIVERNHPKSIIPQCIERQDADDLVPAIIRKSEMVMNGAKGAEISADFDARVESGEYSSPDFIGVNYMMSHYNYIYVQGANSIRRIPPHLMHYAPGVTNAEVQAAPFAASKGLPHINQPGIHGYYISFVEAPSDFSDVQRACAGQMGDFPPS